MNGLIAAGDLIVVVGSPGVQNRAFHVAAWGGQLESGTTGATAGHHAAAAAFTIAAVSVYVAAGGSFSTWASGAFNVEQFSSDGPRTMFYNSDGTPVTPGNVLFAGGGGVTLSKPDLTAADGVSTGLPAYNPFYGTSAAAPHAAAIAALVLQAQPSITIAGMREALSATAIGFGGLYNAGAGIAMAPAAVAASGCTYSLTPAGVFTQWVTGGGSLTVNTQPGCPWTLRGAGPPWLLLIPSSGTGTGTVTFSTYPEGPSPSTSSAVSASLSIGGATYTIELELYGQVPGLSFVGSMPHLVAEGGWNTTLTFVNKSSTPVIAIPSLYDDNGNPLSLPVDFPQQSTIPSGLLASSLYQTIAPNASLVVEAADSTSVPSVEGTAQLSATGAVDGFASFHFSSSNQEAVVPMETRNASSYLLAFDNTTGVLTGVALDNILVPYISFAPATIPVIIRNDRGEQIAAGTVQLGVNGHLHSCCPRSIHRRRIYAAPLSSIRRAGAESVCSAFATRGEH